jgi:hypothetical protein
LIHGAKVGCDFAIEKSKINRISNRKNKTPRKPFDKGEREKIKKCD